MSHSIEIINILRTYGLQNENLANEEIPLFKKLNALIAQGKELTFLLPAFPAKSPSGKKTLGIMPDYAEVLALKNLNDLCQKISKIYGKKVSLIICSDGRVFSDVVNVSDKVIDDYSFGIKEIIEFYKLENLSLFRIDDVYSEFSPERMRDFIIEKYAKDLESVREKVLTNENYQRLFNGMHRFLIEDEIPLLGDSKNAITKRTKAKTYELIRRSEAWTAFIDDYFTDTLRLSIHPHSLRHEKFGISLVPSSSKWATPWHNVVVKLKDRFELMHKAEALKLNAVLKKEADKYAYFEIPAI